MYSPRLYKYRDSYVLYKPTVHTFGSVNLTHTLLVQTHTHDISAPGAKRKILIFLLMKCISIRELARSNQKKRLRDWKVDPVIKIMQLVSSVWFTRFPLNIILSKYVYILNIENFQLGSQAQSEGNFQNSNIFFRKTPISSRWCFNEGWTSTYKVFELI